jgi:tetratricopeptide (TPR) repeat protein
MTKLPLLQRMILFLLAGITFPGIQAQMLRVQTVDVDRRVAAIIKDVESANYYKATTMISELKIMCRAHAATKIPREHITSAFGAAEGQLSALTWLDQGRKSYQAGDWEGALYGFTAAQFAIARLETQVPATERFTRDANEAERQSSPTWLHQAAKSALEAGYLDQALSLVGRELARIPKAYPAPGRLGFQHRAYTLQGLALLEKGDVAAAVKALHESIHEVPAEAFGPAGPSMALASRLLGSGKTDEVAEYLGRCALVGKERQGQLRNWRTVVQSGKSPSFTPAELLY